jgi:putative ABC transport system permease protein
VDREQSINDIRPMQDIVDLEVANRRQQMTLLSGFAILALILASLSIYGVLSYLVTQRTREIGVRIALGATSQSVVRMIVAQGLRLTSLGLAIGLLAAFWMAKLMTALVYGAGTTDPATYAGTTAVLAAVAIIACVVPARTAARVDPIIALREE